MKVNDILKLICSTAIFSCYTLQCDAMPSRDGVQDTDMKRSVKLYFTQLKDSLRKVNGFDEFFSPIFRYGDLRIPDTFIQMFSDASKGDPIRIILRSNKNSAIGNSIQIFVQVPFNGMYKYIPINQYKDFDEMHSVRENKKNALRAELSKNPSISKDEIEKRVALLDFCERSGVNFDQLKFSQENSDKAFSSFLGNTTMYGILKSIIVDNDKGISTCLSEFASDAYYLLLKEAVIALMLSGYEMRQAANVVNSIYKSPEIASYKDAGGFYKKFSEKILEKCVLMQQFPRLLPLYTFLMQCKVAKLSYTSPLYPIPVQSVQHDDNQTQITSTQNTIKRDFDDYNNEIGVPFGFNENMFLCKKIANTPIVFVFDKSLDINQLSTTIKQFVGGEAQEAFLKSVNEIHFADVNTHIKGDVGIGLAAKLMFAYKDKPQSQILSLKGDHVPDMPALITPITGNSSIDPIASVFVISQADIASYYPGLAILCDVLSVMNPGTGQKVFQNKKSYNVFLDVFSLTSSNPQDQEIKDFSKESVFVYNLLTNISALWSKNSAVFAKQVPFHAVVYVRVDDPLKVMGELQKIPNHKGLLKMLDKGIKDTLSYGNSLLNKVGLGVFHDIKDVNLMPVNIIGEFSVESSFKVDKNTVHNYMYVVLVDGSKFKEIQQSVIGGGVIKSAIEYNEKCFRERLLSKYKDKVPVGSQFYY
ncbi:hypothetical protein [Candidatus Gromoviella agglomerans]|uniref:hypothetical protein n=1 Tax=Candidatus Gromoviella agglomerans TaxID=2806609 RepID=UPI001E48E437|nr:hypothetical protein [Candidatus Gromoviella agglomerans]UFX98128.1 hypothetical protein Gromo_00005 [Candidatus Gromoviella agglomerans]